MLFVFFTGSLLYLLDLSYLSESGTHSKTLICLERNDELPIEKRRIARCRTLSVKIFYCLPCTVFCAFTRKNLRPH